MQKQQCPWLQRQDYDLYFKEGYDRLQTFRTFADGIRQYFTEKEEFLITKQTKKAKKSWI